MLDLDGSQGEGGGQILRTSLALALVTGRSFRLRSIRAGRPKPGLQPQHLMSVKAAAQIGQARVRGASLGSTELVFEPGEVIPGEYHFAIGTAGATGLVLHTVYLPLAFRVSAGSGLTISGGTHVLASPSFDFLNRTWRAYLDLLGVEVRLRLRRPGFYPRGGGVIEAEIQPCSHPRCLEVQEVSSATRATVSSAVAGLPENIATRQARRATKRLRDLKLKVETREESWENGPGTVLSIALDTRPVPTLFFGLGARGKPAERVADEAVAQVAAYLATGGKAVDAHSADQLVLPLVLAEGLSTLQVAEVTSHLVTNVATVRQFVDREVIVEGKEGEPGILRVGELGGPLRKTNRE